MSFEKADLESHAVGCNVLAFLEEIKTSNPVLFHQTGWDVRLCTCHDPKKDVQVGIERITIQEVDRITYHKVLRQVPFDPKGLLRMHQVQEEFGTDIELYKDFTFSTSDATEICCQHYRCKKGEYDAYIETLKRINKAIQGLAMLSHNTLQQQAVQQQAVGKQAVGQQDEDDIMAILTPKVMMEREATVLREMISSLQSHGTRFVTTETMQLEHGRIYYSTMDNHPFDKFRLFNLGAPMESAVDYVPKTVKKLIMMIRYEYDYKGLKTAEWADMFLQAVDSALLGKFVNVL